MSTFTPRANSLIHGSFDKPTIDIPNRIEIRPIEVYLIANEKLVTADKESALLCSEAAQGKRNVFPN